MTPAQFFTGLHPVFGKKMFGLPNENSIFAEYIEYKDDLYTIVYTLPGCAL
jgi:hypothetical protein